MLLNIPFFCLGAAASSAVGVTAEPGHAGGESDYRSDPVPGGGGRAPSPFRTKVKTASQVEIRKGCGRKNVLLPQRDKVSKQITVVTLVLSKLLPYCSG